MVRVRVAQPSLELQLLRMLKLRRIGSASVFVNISGEVWDFVGSQIGNANPRPANFAIRLAIEKLAKQRFETFPEGVVTGFIRMCSVTMRIGWWLSKEPRYAYETRVWFKFCENRFDAHAPDCEVWFY